MHHVRREVAIGMWSVLRVDLFFSSDMSICMWVRWCLWRGGSVA